MWFNEKIEIKIPFKVNINSISVSNQRGAELKSKICKRSVNKYSAFGKNIIQNSKVVKNINLLLILYLYKNEEITKGTYAKTNLRT